MIFIGSARSAKLQIVYGLNMSKTATLDTFTIQVFLHVPYPRERGPMGGAPYTGPRLGDGPIFEVSVSHLDAKECPGTL